MGLQIVANRVEKTVSVTAVATVERPAPSRPWRFLLIAVIEHGGHASGEELSTHLVGAPRHPLIDRLLAVAERAGDLERIDEQWVLGGSAREVLEEGHGRTTETGEFEFRVSTTADEVVDVLPASGELRQDRNLRIANRETVPRSVREAIDRIRDRRLPSGLKVVTVDELMLMGTPSEAIVEGATLEHSGVDVPSLLAEALPSGFTWNAEGGFAESPLSVGIACGALRDESGMSASLASWTLRSGETVSDVRLSGIPWRALPDETRVDEKGPPLTAESRVALAKLLVGLEGVPTEAERAQIAKAVPMGLPQVAEFADDNALMRQAGWLRAAWDWDL